MTPAQTIALAVARMLFHALIDGEADDNPALKRAMRLRMARELKAAKLTVDDLDSASEER